MFVISKYIKSVATIGGIPAISTILLGKNVQYPNKNNIPHTKTDGTHAFVRVATTSPINKISTTMTKANICDM
ncbi:hypothetical protein [Listeria ivanovii]|uniref:hypothetical protein n=1 Tax=Listeria ivanovii TaxID=1638 RepID=UPI0035A121F1